MTTDSQEAAAAVEAQPAGSTCAGVPRGGARDAPARARVSVTERVRAVGAHWGLKVREARPPELYAEPPASLAELVEYTRSGAWVPGDQAPALEAAGKLYGYAVAVPVSAVLYLVAWLVQRPSRFALALLLVGVYLVTR